MRRSQQGFTIIELMIATTVVSVVLLMTSVIMINIGNLYYKGITQAKVQSNVRSITDEVAQKLRLTSSPPLPVVASPDGQTQRLCIGDTSYTYVLLKQISDAQHVLWRDKVAPSSCPPPTNGFLSVTIPTITGTELIGPHSRLVEFTLGAFVSPYTVTLNVAYGDDDLLTPDFKRCTGAASNSFCATANLTTTVVQRLH